DVEDIGQNIDLHGSSGIPGPPQDSVEDKSRKGQDKGETKNPQISCRHRYDNGFCPHGGGNQGCIEQYQNCKYQGQSNCHQQRLLGNLVGIIPIPSPGKPCYQSGGAYSQGGKEAV